MKSKGATITLIAMGLVISIAGCAYKRPPWIATECIEGPYARAGAVKDEAQCAKRSAKSFPGADEDYFKDMDYGISQRPDEVVAALEPFVPGISRTPRRL